MTPIEKRKAELREYIEARKKATQGIWNAKMFFPASEDDYDFCDKAANESARIAEELLIALDEIEKASKRLDSIKFDLEFFVKDSIDQALNKIGGEK